jgi:hypothetical protein
MAKSAQNIFIPTDLNGQILQSTGETGLTADSVDIFEASDGTFYREIGSKTVHTTIAKIRASTTALNPNIIYQTNEYGGPGFWVVDTTDTTSTDNLGTILVTAHGDRLKRKYNGNIHALWFGVTTVNNADISVALQAALNAAQTAACDVEFYAGGTYFITSSTVVIPTNVTLKIGNKVTIRIYKDDLAGFRVKSYGRIEGGQIKLDGKTGNKAIWFWGGDVHGVNAAGTGIAGVKIIGDWSAGQVGVWMSVGTDSTGAEIPSNTGQDVTFIDVDCQVYGCEYGVRTQLLGTGSGFITGCMFSVITNCIKNLDIEGSGNLFRGQIETKTSANKPGFTGYWAAKITGSWNRLDMMVWDWSSVGDDIYAIIIDGQNNFIYGAAANYVFNGLGNFTYDYLPRVTIPPGSYLHTRLLGTQDDMLFFADKKFTVTKTTTADLTPCFRQWNTLGVTVSDASTEKSIAIEPVSGFISQSFISIGVSFHLLHVPSTIKIEYKDGDGNWNEVISLSDNTLSEVIGLASAGNIYVYGVRYSFSSSSDINIIRFWMYGTGDPQAFLPCGGGTIYGDLSLNALTSKSYLATDDSGKIIAGSAPDAPDLDDVLTEGATTTQIPSVGGLTIPSIISAPYLGTDASGNIEAVSAPSVDPSFASKITAVNDDYTILVDDDVLLITATDDLTVTLPTTSEFTKKVMRCSYSNGSGKTIQFTYGSILFTTTAASGWFSCIFDGTDWWKLSQA